ncbi:DNA topoisomerase IV alpha subunit [Mycena pura]|uniref:DNA topoisomerase (ATP-hydrolyzing) n=1 Tax=Mycena pura TaxID=153505 RepID=A0AAD6YFU9_9AGAR|nr:DNA topoisomerase IV alpha subunit [Mycena pura]
MSSDGELDIVSDDDSFASAEDLDSSSDEEQDAVPISCAADRIEDFMVSFLDQLADENGGPLKLRVADRRAGGGAMRTICFPTRRVTGSARQIAQLCRVLDLMHKAVVTSVPMTKRDIYYMDVALFKTQRTVDNARSLPYSRMFVSSRTGQRATSKGLVCGSGLVIHLVSGEKVQANDTEGVLIPVGEDIKAITVDEDVNAVLVVEKDAVFQTLCRQRLANHPRLKGRILIVTKGKGYPDVATRQMVATLSTRLPHLPIFCLVDGDPYGLDILSVYKYGSRAMAHEGDKLAAGRIEYLGIFLSELANYRVDLEAVLPITKKDEKKARAILRRPIPAKWKKELSYMLHLRRKAEIEILDTAAGLVDAPGNEGYSGRQGTECALVRYLVDKIRDSVEL